MEGILLMGEIINIYKILKKKGEDLLSVLSSPCKRVPSDLEGSMTVEACFVLPFFLFAFLNIMSIIDIYKIQGDMNCAIHDTEKQMAMYAYEYSQIGGSKAITYLYAANKVKSKMGDNYPSNVSWIRSSVMNGDDCIDLIAEYTISPPISLMGYGKCRMYNRLRTRAWTGYDNAGLGSNATEEDIVYITETGQVYHRSRACTYLKLSITTVSKSSLETERSLNGSKYHGCEECSKVNTNTVYITNYGNRYHTTLECSKLKRTVHAVTLSEAGGRGACSKCGGLK